MRTPQKAAQLTETAIVLYIHGSSGPIGLGVSAMFGTYLEVHG